MHKMLIGFLAVLFGFAVSAEEMATKVPAAKASPAVLASYRRLLPLEGGSNFRDLGGYPAAADQVYLDQFGFESVIDLRSAEEIELYPNQWAAASSISTIRHEYSIVSFMAQAKDLAEREEKKGDDGKPREDSGFYRYALDMLRPQLKSYFATLIAGQVPAVVNCSAGQDRTGVTSALLLSVLGVERELIIEDYLLSTDFRDPSNETGAVDLKEAAKTNAFAEMMLGYRARSAHPGRPNPLVTAEGKPFLETTLEFIDSKWGDVGIYLEDELGISAVEQAQLRKMYLY
jgi:protein-tyrosine phosphatase